MLRCFNNAAMRNSLVREVRMCEKKSFYLLVEAEVPYNHPMKSFDFSVAYTSSLTVKMNQLFDSRANAKIDALQNLKDSSSDGSVTLLTEDPLVGAYAQAIKYVSRSRHVDAALYANNLLSEAIQRAGGVFEVPAKRNETESPTTKSEFAEQWTQAYEHLNKWNEGERKGTKQSNPIQPPEKKSFHQVLHAWADSKVRRKGVYANNILKNMIMLASSSPDFRTMPDSKAFAIAAKCWSGSTHRHSFQHIIELHRLHDRMADMNIDGIIRDDPFFLMHSIKSVKNYKINQQEKSVSLWFDRLHSYVSSKNNFNPDDAVIDLTGTYTGMIREHAKARNRQSATKAKRVLQRMKDLKDSESKIASIEIQQNAYDLLLGTLRDSKHGNNSLEAVKILREMVSSVENIENSAPHPTLNSFVYTLQSLSFVLDKEEALNLVSEVIKMLEELYAAGTRCPIERSRDPYNALIFAYANIFEGKIDILDRVSNILSLLDEHLDVNPDMTPDVRTWSAVLRACSVVKSPEVTEKEKALTMATKTFERLKDSEVSGDLEITDDCYFHMMKCVSTLSRDDQTKETDIIMLFKDAARKGLVSASVLKLLKASLPNKKYKQIVGSGRLADSWIKNVTSIKAMYTDGTKGGPDKNARRKGKSTSDWIKKKKINEQRLTSLKAKNKKKSKKQV